MMQPKRSAGLKPKRDFAAKFFDIKILPLSD
jgi:hypothetical protein